MKTLQIIFILLGIALAACRQTPPAANEAEASSGLGNVPYGEEITLAAESVKALNIRLAAPEIQVSKVGVVCTGYIEVPPQSLATITTPYGGFIKEIRPYPGSYVRKGEVLAVLSHPDYIALQKEYLQSKSELAYLSKEYERQQKLVAQNAGTEKILQKTTSDYQVLQAQVFALKAQLQLIGIDTESLTVEQISSEISIRAPFSGYIARVPTNFGKYAGPNEEICSIINKHHLHLELQVFEKDMYRVAEKQKILFSVANARNTQTYEAEVRIVAQNVDPERRTLTVHGHMEDHLSATLKPGTFVNATILTDPDTVQVLPGGAWVGGENGEPFVLVRSGENSFRKVKLEKGDRQDGGMIVKDVTALGPKTEVVVGGSAELYHLMREAMGKAGD